MRRFLSPGLLRPVMTCAVLAVMALLSSSHSPSVDAATPKADLALVLAVDVSGSMDTSRYVLQMEGIARALEDPAVVTAMLSGRHRSMLLAVVEWADRPVLSVPWTLITGQADANAVAARIRILPRVPGDFTCMAQALRMISDKTLPSMPAQVERVVIDVSGDGHDNCNSSPDVPTMRDMLAGDGVTINGLPILEGDEATTLKGWYASHVVGGPGGFLVPAESFREFGDAFRRKFTREVSALPVPESLALTALEKQKMVRGFGAGFHESLLAEQFSHRILHQ
ncbi:Hypothetical protein GbCGDNIH6_1872 [Granulibacter bethesdensis]|uniref:DUF1194 domain-containing protein n=1 Tax=Granulibacter bethesdensis TaxID=364410 RepID=UPI0009098C57|nr:DUF1194 domain-containing protein [Granulibacter bethesdensis]APH57691.1 Hypothetical protein GbCGDNIH6_1872 [Granulibacter bethesdensis]